ncbi:MAG: nicotinate-nucleotide adenylyltransferase, partial [Pseudomonadota bacterium]
FIHKYKMKKIAKFLKLPHTESGTTIGLLGGSFNPPHAGHHDISLHMLQQLNLHQLWWLVSPGNPLKSKTELQSLERRLQLCQQYTSHPKIKITAFEAARPDVFTAHTLQFLKQKKKSNFFVWIMGADNLVNFNLWEKWQHIFLTYPIAIHDRSGFRYKALSSTAATYFRKSKIPQSHAKNLAYRAAPAWTYLSAPLNDISSTAIRQKNSKEACTNQQVILAKSKNIL